MHEPPLRVCVGIYTQLHRCVHIDLTKILRHENLQNHYCYKSQLCIKYVTVVTYESGMMLLVKYKSSLYYLVKGVCEPMIVGQHFVYISLFTCCNLIVISICIIPDPS